MGRAARLTEIEMFAAAFSFRTRAELAPVSELLRHLRANTAIEWFERYSDFWGEYVSATVGPRVTAKIFLPEDDDDRHVVELIFRDDTLRDDWEAAAENVLKQFMPQLEATDVQSTETRT